RMDANRRRSGLGGNLVRVSIRCDHPAPAGVARLSFPARDDEARRSARRDRRRTRPRTPGHRRSMSDEVDPRPAAVSFMTTEHFVLQGARASTIAESAGRANMFLA